MTSPAAYLASLSPAKRTILLGDLRPEDHARLSVYWPFWARAEQRPPESLPDGRDWVCWMYCAGRGSGKTRAGTEWVRDQVRRGFRHISFIGPTASDVRKVMIEGESGLLAVSQHDDREYRTGDLVGIPDYQPSNRKIEWTNGAVCNLFSAEEPERLRGPQHEKVWADEVGSWRNQQHTWDMMMFGLRLGPSPQVAATTTPRVTPLIRELLRDHDNVVTRGTTFDNAANLNPRILQKYRDRYEGTDLGRQELYAEVLEENQGALWSRLLISDSRVSDPPEFDRVVVAVDPAAKERRDLAENGIVTVGTAMVEGVSHAYIIGDASGRMSPDKMGKTAVREWRRTRADRIVAEVNNGGDMVETIIRQVDPDVPYRSVWASSGKRARAEPVSALYEQGRVHHVGTYRELEDQMVSWEPLSGDRSPDRIDALVWGVTEVLLGSSYSLDGV